MLTRISLIVICALGVATATPTIASESLATQGASVEELIARYFPQNFKTMRAISKCESGLVHRVNGKLLPNAKGSTARGSFQLLMGVHGPEMKRLGLDPENDDDYMTYVKYLVKEQGLTPWKACLPA